MDSLSFSGFGIKFIQRGGRFLYGMTRGELVIQIEEVEVTKAEAATLEQDEQSAYQVLLAAQAKTARP